MKYKNAAIILPKELLEKVQQYIQGEYLYIPIKEKQEKIDVTEYKQELQKRDERIYVSYLEAEFELLLTKLEERYENLPVQLIHRDVHFGNFLFWDGTFSGYIDFDLSQRNIRIFDLCYFMLGLLSEEEKLDITKEEWFHILEKVFAGYQQISPLTSQEKQAVPYVMKSIELLFAAWFSTQNDTVCAEDAMKIFSFVDANEKEILNELNKHSNEQKPLF